MSTRRQHRMPFGAVPVDGGVRFRLWAPAAHRVELLLGPANQGRCLGMRGGDFGWYEITTPLAAADSRYRFRIDGTLEVPDPAARASDDVHGPAAVVDPDAFVWSDTAWSGRPWHEAVIYELHVGTFTPQGTFAAVEDKLQYLARLGVTLLELMPVADFPGRRGWGYDGVLPYAPDAAYGTAADLKRLVAAAHGAGLGVMLDVVYNHFGPEGNWLHAYAPQFFTDRYTTPWGAAINFDGPHSRTVRDFFIHNALYWLEEYHLDGLRIDAVHAMHDRSTPDFVTELVRAVRAGPGRDRHVHVVLENHANESHRLGVPGSADRADAQWNDDLHHALHVILTGETDGYYVDYAERPHALLARALAEGFSYQGEPSRHMSGRPRGEPSTGLPPTAFVSFLQTHDQIGNRAFGERLASIARSEAALRAATAILLLAPSPPMLFMGEEWAAPEPFLYFCDFEAGLAQKVRDGRRREFARFAPFAADAGLPDPVAVSTFERSRLDWGQRNRQPHARWLALHRRLLAIRRRDIVPLIADVRAGSYLCGPDHGVLAVEWPVGDRATLRLLANLGESPAPLIAHMAGRPIFSTHANVRRAAASSMLEPWRVTWLLERTHAARTRSC